MTFDFFFLPFFLEGSRTSGEMDGALEKLPMKLPIPDPNCTLGLNKVLLKKFGLYTFLWFFESSQLVHGQFEQFLQSCLQYQIMKHHRFFSIFYGLSTEKLLSHEIADDN